VDGSVSTFAAVYANNSDIISIEARDDVKLADGIIYASQLLEIIITDDAQ